VSAFRNFPVKQNGIWQCSSLTCVPVSAPGFILLPDHPRRSLYLLDRSLLAVDLEESFLAAAVAQIVGRKRVRFKAIIPVNRPPVKNTSRPRQQMRIK
jgi:hypothetical protein